MVIPWEKKKIGDFLKLEYGKPLDKSFRKNDGKYPVYGANGIKTWSDQFYCDKATIIVGRKGSAGELTLTQEYFWPLDVTYFVKFDEKKYDLKFIYFLLSRLDLPSLATGVKPGINRNNVYDIDVNVPYIETQKQIVAKLDQAFAEIEKAKVNAEQNLINARELFDSYLNNVFSNYLDSLVDLNSITEVKDGTHDSPKYVENGIPFVTQKNIGKSGLNFNKIKFITEENHDHFYKRSNVALGDILLSMIGANRGMSCIVDDSRTFSIKNICLIKNTEAIDMQFLLYYLRSPFVLRYIESESRGGAQPFIGLTKLRKLPVPKIDMSRQVEIGKRLHLLKIKSTQLESIYTAKINALEELKQSILQKAFKGELT